MPVVYNVGAENLYFSYQIFAMFITPIAVTVALVYLRLYNKIRNELIELNCELEELKAHNEYLNKRLCSKIEDEVMTDEQKLHMMVGEVALKLFKCIFDAVR